MWQTRRQRSEAGGTQSSVARRGHVESTRRNMGSAEEHRPVPGGQSTGKGGRTQPYGHDERNQPAIQRGLEVDSFLEP